MQGAEIFQCLSPPYSPQVGEGARPFEAGSDTVSAKDFLEDHHENKIFSAIRRTFGGADGAAAGRAAGDDFLSVGSQLFL